jgi:S1-C subfamily serine protease
MLLSLAVVAFSSATSRAGDVDAVRKAEQERSAVIEKVRPAVVAIYSQGGQGGGSGVLIDKDGYALTNFHVVQGSGPVMQCGLPDGVLYDAVLVGLDKVGDVALVKLLPKKEGKPFPFAPLGDSDKIREGDWSLAMGNPFLLATDFTPTVTFGLISGVHRYQYPEGTLLEYTDCIQIDTSINPGNSGGPLFNMQGELIGINGRGSFDKRRRINSGVGYAISINQIKNFLGHLRAGLDTDHASLVRVQSATEDIPRLEVREVLPDSDAARRGIEEGDELIAFAGRPLTSVNEFKNILGIFPKDWRMPLEYRRKNDRKEVLVRLMGVMAKEAQEEEDPSRPRPGPSQRPARPPIPNTPAKAMYVERKGFANYYFNEKSQQRLWHAFRKHGDFTLLKGDWVIEGALDMPTRKATFSATVGEQKLAEKDTHTVVKVLIDANDYVLDPLKQNMPTSESTAPTNSGGLLMALYQYRMLLSEGLGGFGRNVAHGGEEPFYPPRIDGTAPKHLRDLRVDTEVLRTEAAAVPVKWYFSKDDHHLLGFEVFTEQHADPCEIYCSDYRPVDGRQLPYRLEIRYGDGAFGTILVKSYKLAVK